MQTSSHKELSLLGTYDEHQRYDKTHNPHTTVWDYPTQAVTFRMLLIAKQKIFTQLDTLLAEWPEVSDRILNSLKTHILSSFLYWTYVSGSLQVVLVKKPNKHTSVAGEAR